MQNSDNYLRDGHLKGPDCQTVGNRVPLCLALFDLYFAHSTSSLLKMTTTTAMAGGELLGWPAPQCCCHTSVMSGQQRCVDRKSLIRISPRSSTKDPSPQTLAICNLEFAVRPYLNAMQNTHSTNLYDKMLINCSSSSNNPVLSCDNIQINLSNVF